MSVTSTGTVQDDERLFQSGVQRRTTVTLTEDSDAGILGRLHAARTIDVQLPGLARLVALAKANRTPQAWTIDGDAFVSFFGGMRPIVHHGDLHVRGSLLIDEHAWLIVTGNLTVDGIVSDHRPCTLAVGGDLVAPRIVTTGDVYVLGSIEASEVLLARNGAFESQRSALSVGGCIRARLFLRHLRDVTAGSIAADEDVDLGDSVRMSTLRCHFSDDAFASSGEIDPDRCDRLLRCGLSVRR